MNFHQYQKAAVMFAIYPRDMAIVYPALGLASEAGEVCDKIKKSMRDQHHLDRMGVLKELGDVLWYITLVADDMGFSLNDVALENLDKLNKRKSNNTIKGSGDDR